MGLPPFPVGRGAATVIAVLVPLTLVVALVPAIIVWPFLSANRQDRLYRIVDLTMRRTREIVGPPSPGRPGPGARLDGIGLQRER